MTDLQTIPARHGTATFVPAGQVIKIVNTSGTQVVDTWAFALPKPEGKKGEVQQDAAQNGQQEKKEDSKPATTTTKAAASKTKKGGMNLPSQEEAEKATQEGVQEGEDAANTTQQKSTWGSYVPSIGWSKKGGKQDDNKQESEQQKDSKTWASYFPSGQGFSNYIPETAKDSVSTFASSVRPHLTGYSCVRPILTDSAAQARSKQDVYAAVARSVEDTSWSSRLGR